MAVKKCSQCKKVKPLESFYKHSQMADGHLGKCKACVKNQAREHYHSPAAHERILRYEKRRNQTRERKANRLRYQRDARKRSPGRFKARLWVSNAIRDGRLKRLPCEVCQNPKSEAHHTDYRKPQQVRWLCFKHHRQVDLGKLVI